MWSAFGGTYDFAYLVEILSGSQPQSQTLHEFMVWARELLDDRMFIVKYKSQHFGHVDICISALRRMAFRLDTPILNSEPPCLAGSVSHTACCVYMVIQRHFTDPVCGMG